MENRKKGKKSNENENNYNSDEYLEELKRKKEMQYFFSIHRLSIINKI